MSTDNTIWKMSAEWLHQSMNEISAIDPTCPNLFKTRMTPGEIQETFKIYQGNNRQAKYFAEMEPKIFYCVFVTRKYGGYEPLVSVDDVLQKPEGSVHHDETCLAEQQESGH